MQPQNGNSIQVLISLDRNSMFRNNPLKTFLSEADVYKQTPTDSSAHDEDRNIGVIPKEIAAIVTGATDTDIGNDNEENSVVFAISVFAVLG